MTILKQFLREDDGVTALEYGMIAALIAAIIVASVQTLGTKIDAAFQNVATKI
ncbi:MAG: hypothetical protein ACD_16C00051G0010 [uncultured bacterium]|nr:MAG: hypothetical protein ACD_16C00051G0010 [uncultured bacterium]